MKKLSPIAIISAKKNFQNLRKQAPFYCTDLNQKIEVTKIFYDHIAFVKRRNFRDLIERCLIVPFIEDILTKGTLTETREIKNQLYYKISLKVKTRTFCSIITKNLKGNFVVLSCFIEQQKQKTTRLDFNV